MADPARRPCRFRVSVDANFAPKPAVFLDADINIFAPNMATMPELTLWSREAPPADSADTLAVTLRFQVWDSPGEPSTRIEKY
jgi:hypothetical protein